MGLGPMTEKLVERMAAVVSRGSLKVMDDADGRVVCVGDDGEVVYMSADGDERWLILFADGVQERVLPARGALAEVTGLSEDYRVAMMVAELEEAKKDDLKREKRRWAELKRRARSS